MITSHVIIVILGLDFHEPRLVGLLTRTAWERAMIHEYAPCSNLSTVATVGTVAFCLYLVILVQTLTN